MAMATSAAVILASASSSRLFSSPRCISDGAGPPSTSSSAAGDVGSVKMPVSALLRPLKFQGGESAGTGRPAVLDPATQYANLMWFRGSYNAQIFVSEDEPADSVVRRFRKAVMQAGVIPECRRRRFFETPQDIAKRKLQSAQRRNKSRRFTPRPDAFTGEKKDGGGGSKAAADDDYWGYTDE